MNEARYYKAVNDIIKIINTKLKEKYLKRFRVN